VSVFHRAGIFLAAALAGTASAAVAGSDRLIVDPDSPYVFSDTDQSAADPNSNVVLRGSVGVASISALEKVYAFPTGSDYLSLLTWDSVAPIATGDVKVRLFDGWTLRGRIDAAIAGDSNMVDYDWTSFSPSYAMDDWDHRSISPNTSLDWYLNGEVALGRDLPINEALTVNVNGGLSYTDVEWTASGGTYIYSNAIDGFRGDVGTLPDGPGLRYRQQLPALFAGVDATVDDGPWNLEAGARAGMTFMARDVDHHYLRHIIFTDDLSFAQIYSANAKLGYDISDHLGAFIEADYSRMISGRGDEDELDTQTGVTTHFPGSIGGELQVASLKAGLKGRFSPCPSAASACRRARTCRRWGRGRGGWARTPAAMPTR
jgi:plasminogen activator